MHRFAFKYREQKNGPNFLFKKIFAKSGHNKSGLLKDASLKMPY